jgi:hypothetical protein
VVANPGGREQVILCEIGSDHAEDFWRYPNGNMERVHETSHACMSTSLISCLVHSSLDMRVNYEKRKENRLHTSSRVRSGGLFWLVGMSANAGNIGKELTNSIDTMRSRKVSTSFLMVGPSSGQISLIDVVIEGQTSSCDEGGRDEAKRLMSATERRKPRSVDSFPGHS